MARDARNAVGAAGAAQREGGRGRGPSRGRPRIAERDRAAIPVGRGRWGRCAAGGQARDGRIGDSAGKLARAGCIPTQGDARKVRSQDGRQRRRASTRGLPGERWQECHAIVHGYVYDQQAGSRRRGAGSAAGLGVTVGRGGEDVALARVRVQTEGEIPSFGKLRAGSRRNAGNATRRVDGRCWALRRMCSLRQANVFSFPPNVFTFRSNVFTVECHVFSGGRGEGRGERREKRTKRERVTKTGSGSSGRRRAGSPRDSDE